MEHRRLGCPGHKRSPAELLEVCVYDFADLLDQYGVELKYVVQELEEDVRSLKELGRRVPQFVCAS